MLSLSPSLSPAVCSSLLSSSLAWSRHSDLLLSRSLSRCPDSFGQLHQTSLQHSGRLLRRLSNQLLHVHFCQCHCVQYSWLQGTPARHWTKPGELLCIVMYWPSTPFLVLTCMYMYSWKGGVRVPKGGHGSVVERWRLKSVALGSIPGGCPDFSLPASFRM